MSAEDVAISRLFWMLRDRAAPLCSRLRRRRRWAFPRPCAPQAILVSFKCFVLCWRGVHNCVSIRLIKLSLFCTECLDLHRYLRRFRWVLIIPPALPDRRLSDDFAIYQQRQRCFHSWDAVWQHSSAIALGQSGNMRMCQKNWKNKVPLAFFQFGFLLIFIERCRRSVTMAQLAAALLTAGSRYWNELIGNWFHCVAVEDEERRCQPSEDLRPRQQSSRKIRFNDFKFNVNDIILIRLITANFFGEILIGIWMIYSVDSSLPDAEVHRWIQIAHR